jgi:putative restriction endonuclease
MNALQHYIHKFSRLKVDRSKGAPAPHKPILLLAVMQCIEVGEITKDWICITPELVSRFKDLFRLLGGSFTPNFSLPFYHLGSSGFWHLQTMTGKEILLTKSLSIRSFAHLKEVVAYAYVDEALFQLLLQKESREVLKRCLLQTYFNEKQLPEGKHYSLFDTVKEEILQEVPVVYKTKVEMADEEEIFVRCGVFKKVVPQIYNYTCCISGMRIIVNREVQMVDACHIVPFSESHDDTISNGISLCPNLHRAFDRFLIAINEYYRVEVSNTFIEQGDNYSIKAYEGKELILPKDKEYKPSLENLKWHYQQFTALNDL